MFLSNKGQQIWNNFYRAEEITRKENDGCYNLHETNRTEMRIRL